MTRSLHCRSADNGEDSRSKMSVHQIWDFIQKARDTNVSMAKLALIKVMDRESGVKRGSVFLWQRKLLSLYKQDSSLSFLGVRKLSMVSDSSHHSTKDWLVSLFYNSSANCFAHATAQFVKSAKNLRPGQFELLPEVELHGGKWRELPPSSFSRLSAVSASRLPGCKCPISSHTLSCCACWPR